MHAITDELCEMFERFLQLPTGNVQQALSNAADLVANALGAEKVDVFVHDAQRSSLVAIGTSHQALSDLQRKAGLDVLPIANGGLVVKVFQTHQPLLTGSAKSAPEELLGIREVLKVESQIAVLLEIGGKPHGVLGVSSRKRDVWSSQHLSFTRAAARWVGIVAHRAELIAELERRSVDQGRRAAAEELVTVVAHDLRNYLSPLGIRLNLLARRAQRDGREDDIRELDRSLESLSRIGAFISDLLDVARLDHGMFELRTEPVDLSALAEDIASIASTAQKDVQVTATQPLFAHVDPPRIRQCVENLVANALAHSPRGAIVTVNVVRETRASGPWARLEVIDEGPGISEKLLPHIFEPFVSGKRSREGLGLGLYIGKRIAILHGGDLTADKASGKGARFVLTLPLDPDVAEPSTQGRVS